MKLFVALVGAVCLLAVPAMAGIGARYGERDPRTCQTRDMPKSGPPTAQQAAYYLACDEEKESGDELYLISDIKVVVASVGRAVNFNDSVDQVDQSKAVYDIHGSYKRYQCQLLDSLDAKQNPGRSCNLADQPNASGVCWVSTFGEWHCQMLDPMHFHFTEEHVPLPK